MSLLQVCTGGSHFLPEIGGRIQSDDVCSSSYIKQQNLQNPQEHIDVSVVEINLVRAEGGRQIGAMQVAGPNDMLQIPFFLTTGDYVIMGEELYAAGAYLSQEPTMLACLAAQDRGKLLIIFICLIGTLAGTIAAHLGTFNWFAELILW